MSDIILPSGWPRPSGYAQGVVASGRILTVSGQIGWDESCQLVGPAFLEQALQALRNIVVVVRAAGGEPEHLMRLTWYVVDCDEYRSALSALGAGYREIVGPVYPAMTLVQMTYSVAAVVSSVAVGDLNGDGVPDIVVGHNGGSQVSILIGNGSGGYEPFQTLAVKLRTCVSKASGSSYARPGGTVRLACAAPSGCTRPGRSRG